MSLNAVVLELPFDLSFKDLELEEGSKDSMLSAELKWLLDNATEDELPRILTAALCLRKVRGFPIADCLSTAIIWERG